MVKCILTPALLLLALFSHAENGYELWLRYKPLPAGGLRNQYASLSSAICLPHTGATLQVIRQELITGFEGMVGKKPTFAANDSGNYGMLIALATHRKMAAYLSPSELQRMGNEGFCIKTLVRNGKSLLLIAANTPAGLLYGTFHLLRMAATLQEPLKLNLVTAPSIQLRMLNHWDNLNRHVERGYAGESIWKWHTLPDYIDQRYIDYARANASIGINSTVLTNVNANATVLTTPYLQKVKALADVFRPYGIKVYLTARFSAPIEIGKLKTADPLEAQVQQWWADKAKEIYRLIPDFGGFLVKANSEGQPGPQNYGRNHAHGANMLARAVLPFGGVVIWRAFVYSNEKPDDRFKQAYDEFVPLDGQFDKNVIIQVKNGPIDFQPREPFHPLFGALPKTATGMEFQLTQEYLGFATHLVYQAPMFKEVLDADTRRPAAGSTVGDVISGKSFGYKHSLMAGVANIGSDINWTGHPFAQANWYALGRLAWNPAMDAATIAQEWASQTFTGNAQAASAITNMMLGSHQALVNYMTPLGLHHIMGYGHHYGPAPWYNRASRDDWNCTYFHRADSLGIGFNRTASGSNALSQYHSYWQQQWGTPAAAGERWLLWFHHVPWNYNMPDGNTLWHTLCLRYQQGVEGVRAMRNQWRSMQPYIDKERFGQITMLLGIQEKEAAWWRDACLSYFQTFSRMPLPPQVEKPAFSLEHLKSFTFPYAPGSGQ